MIVSAHGRGQKCSLAVVKRPVLTLKKFVFFTGCGKG